MSDSKITIDELARMVQKGFDGLTTEVNSRFNEVDDRLGKLERGQEEIKLRLDNVPYRFELKELDHRVTVLENKAVS